MGVPFPHFPPLWRESRAGVEAAALFRSAVWRGGGVPDGEGRPVLLIPGFLAGDGSLATMTPLAARERLPHAPRRRSAPTSAARRRAAPGSETRLERLAEASGQRVAIIGQSRGGVFARALAVRRPDLVSGIVTLGLADRAASSARTRSCSPRSCCSARSAPAACPGMFSLRCLRGDCCVEFQRDLVAAFPPEVGYTALYSKTDGVVDWRACLDPAAEQVEVRASHIGMGLNAEVYAEVGHALGARRRRVAGRRPPRLDVHAHDTSPPAPGPVSRSARR